MRLLFSNEPFLIPILRSFQGNEFDLIVFDPNFKKILDNLDVPAATLADSVSDRSRILEQAFSCGAQIIRGYTPNFSSNGVSEHVRARFESTAPAWLYSKLVDLAFTVLALDEVKPDLLVLHNDVEPVMRTMAAWAKAHDVPCLHVPHAVYIDVNRGEVGTDIHDIVTASHIAAAGPYQRDWYAARGSATIVETGLPRFDSWSHMPMTRERARRLLKIGKNDPVVVFGSTWRQNTNLLGYNDEWAELYERVLIAFAAMPDIRLIVKLHPRTDAGAANWHAEQAKKHDVAAIFTAAHLESVLYAADLIYAPFGSNVLLESTFIPDLRLMTTYGYEEDNAVIKAANDTDALIKTIKAELGSAPRDKKEMQYKYLGVPDGHAADRVTALCEELLKCS